MNNATEQFTATNKANLQSMESLTTQAYAGVEKLVELNMAVSKALLGESFAHAKAVMGVKDAQEFMALQSNLFKPMAEKSAAYAEHLQVILAGTSAEFSKAVEAKSAEAQKALAGVVENMTKNAPAGTETAVAAFKSALTAGQNVVENAQTSAKKAVEAAQANFSTAAAQAVEAVKKATNVA